MASEFPVLNMEKLDGEERPATMELLRDACENWGFFEVPACPFDQLINQLINATEICVQLLNHGISHELMDEVERLTKEHYSRCRANKFNEFASRALERGEAEGEELKDVDWESTFFLRHLPVSNMDELADMEEEYK